MQFELKPAAVVFDAQRAPASPAASSDAPFRPAVAARVRGRARVLPLLLVLAGAPLLVSGAAMRGLDSTDGDATVRKIPITILPAVAPPPARAALHPALREQLLPRARVEAAAPPPVKRVRPARRPHRPRRAADIDDILAAGSQ